MTGNIVEKLHVEARNWKALVQALLDEYAVEESELLDTLEGQTAFFEGAAAIGREIVRLEAMAEATKAIAKGNKERADRMEILATKYRTLLANTMQDVKVTKVPAPDMTISFRINAPRPIVANEMDLPAEFWREKIVRNPDLTKIASYVASGEPLPAGVAMSNGSPVVTIRPR